MPERQATGEWTELAHRVADNVPAMLAYWDRDKCCRFANRAYEQWFGVKPASLIGKHIRELLGPLYPLNLPYIEEALRGNAQAFEREIPDPAGGPPRFSSAHYIPDVVDGAIRGFFVLVSDITAAKRAHLELAASEARFSGIVSLAADGIITADVDQRITLFNAGAERMFGYTAAEVLGTPLERLLPERHRQIHHAHMAAFLADSASRAMGRAGMTIVGLRKNGSEFPAETAISCLEVEHTMFLTAIVRDVTDRERTLAGQRFLAEAGTVLASSLDCKETLRSIAQLAIIDLGDLCIVDMFDDDQQLVRITAVHSDPAKAAACERLTSMSHDVDHVLAAATLRTGQPQCIPDLTLQYCSRFARNEDHLALIQELAPRSVLVVPLVAMERVLGAIVIGSSKPHQYDQRDLELAMELARRSSLAISNARSYEAEKRATRMRDHVLAIVAHDLRSPLNAIQLAAQLLERRLDRSAMPSAAEDASSILRSLKRANRLIEDLLDVTRLEAGVLKLSHQSLVLDDVLAEALDDHRAAAADARVTLRLEVVAGLPAVRCDRHRVLQVLDNLIGNALKFTPAGGSITIRAGVEGEHVQLAVVDTGKGVHPALLPHVFDRFWQADRAMQRGAGLGLTICKGIVEGYGGRIWAESTLSQGTTFYFTLPFAALHTLAAATVADDQDRAEH